MGLGRAVILLDTAALLWIVAGEPVSPEVRDQIESLWHEGHPPQVSPISAWEVGVLAARGRIILTMAPQTWWEAMIARSGFELAPMPQELLIASSQLPGAPPSDPAQRIIAATAREQGLRLVTRNARLLAYAAGGHLDAVAC